MYEGNKKFCLDKINKLNKDLKNIEGSLNFIISRKSDLKNYFILKKVKLFLLVSILFQVGVTLLLPYLIPVTFIAFIMSVRTVNSITEELKRDCYQNFTWLRIQDEKKELLKLDDYQQNLMQETNNIKKQIKSCEHLVQRLDYYSDLIEKNNIDCDMEDEEIENNSFIDLEKFLDEKIDYSKVYFDNSLPIDFSNSYNDNSKKLVKKI